MIFELYVQNVLTTTDEAYGTDIGEFDSKQLCRKMETHEFFYFILNQ